MRQYSCNGGSDTWGVLQEQKTQEKKMKKAKKREEKLQKREEERQEREVCQGAIGSCECRCEGLCLLETGGYPAAAKEREGAAQEESGSHHCPH